MRAGDYFANLLIEARFSSNAQFSLPDVVNQPFMCLARCRRFVTSIKEIVASRKNAKVLDLGGGTGRLIAHHFFGSTDLEWVYVDDSMQMAEQFRSNLAGTKLKKTIRIEEIDDHLKGVTLVQFDVIVLSLVLTSMKKNPDWTAIASRLLFGGRLIVAEIDAAKASMK